MRLLASWRCAVAIATHILLATGCAATTSRADCSSSVSDLQSRWLRDRKFPTGDVRSWLERGGDVEELVRILGEPDRISRDSEVSSQELRYSWVFALQTPAVFEKCDGEVKWVYTTDFTILSVETGSNSVISCSVDRWWITSESESHDPFDQSRGRSEGTYACESLPTVVDGT